MKKAIRNLIIGKDVYIESRNEYRQIMLSGQYALLALLAVIFYFLMTISNGLSLSSLGYAGSAGLMIASLITHRLGKHWLANSLLFPTLNILLLVIVSSESRATLGFLFFLPLAIGMPSFLCFLA
jgi:hypothetical protein